MYMTPEQADGAPVDPRSDLFSQGSDFHTMCTGRPPFRAETTIAILRRVVEGPPRPIREVNPEVPDWLARIVARLHEKDPADRPQSAAEVAELLGRCLAYLEQPDRMPPPDLPARRPAAAPRPRRLRSLVAAALLVATCGLVAAEAVGVTRIAAPVGTVLRISTPDGALLVEVNDPAVKVSVDGEAVVIQGTGPEEVRVRPGPHRVLGTREGAKVNDEVIEIRRGDSQLVKVTREFALRPPPPVPAAAPGGTLGLPGPEPVPRCPRAEILAAAPGRVRDFAGHIDWVRAVAFLPDGRRAISTAMDQTLRLWRAGGPRPRPPPNPGAGGGRSDRSGRVPAGHPPNGLRPSG